MLGTKAFQSLFLWCSRKGEVRAVGAHLSFLHQFQDQVVSILYVVIILLSGLIHTVSSNTTLGAMSLVDDDGKVLITHVADGITHKRKLLYRGDNNTFPLLNSLFQSCLIGIASRISAISVGNNLVALSEGLDIICYLFVKQLAIRYHNHRIKQSQVRSLCPQGIHRLRTGLDQLKSQPCQRVRLT